MDRLIKAQNKAFRAAALSVAKKYGYEFEPEQLDRWVAQQILVHGARWRIIWDRAIRYSDKWWAKTLEDAQEKLRQLGRSLDKVQMLNREQERSIRALMENNQKLLAKVAMLENDLALAQDELFSERDARREAEDRSLETAAQRLGTTPDVLKNLPVHDPGCLIGKPHLTCTCGAYGRR